MGRMHALVFLVVAFCYDDGVFTGAEGFAGGEFAEGGLRAGWTGHGFLAGHAC